MQNSWINSVVFYHIYPRSFKDSNSDGIGDLNGIIEKLDYLKDLGVGGIWLSPVYKSPMVDFGYDISDYYVIDSIFGNLEDFKLLIGKAHQKNIKIIMDFVPNHTSDKHPLFLKSSASKDSPWRDYYIWHEPKKNGHPPNNWLSVFGGSAWEWDKQTGEYYLHSFLKEQPDLNWRNPVVRKLMFQVLKFWLDLGVDGFRVDAIHHLYKDKLLRNNPKNPSFKPGKDDPFDEFTPLYIKWQPEMFEETANLCHFINKYKDKFVVTEVYGEIYQLMKFYQACSKKLPKKKQGCIAFCPFNLQLISLPWKASAYKTFIDEYDATLCNGELPNYVLGNHDRSRIATRIGTLQARVAAIMLLTLRGVPFIYYGDEIGMKDVTIPKKMVFDPFEKNIPGKGLGRDPERTPMQWDNKPHAGFSKVTPWLPVSGDFKKFNVSSELKDKKSILSLYKKLIHLRNNSEVLQEGKYYSLPVSTDIFAYIRAGETGKLLVVLNFSAKKQTINFKNFAKGKMLINSYLDTKHEKIVDLNKLILQGNEGYVFAV
ncbi:alpha-amylase [Candidatus Daviesbacteria bacterium]|nr:alpha-amylase [Candidatus Daviesbacteria bacterium]